MNDVSDIVLNINGAAYELVEEACATKAEEYENSDRSKLDKEINEACDSRTLRTGLIHRLLILRSLILRLLILRLLRSLILGLLIEVIIHNDISLKNFFDNIIIYLIIFNVNYIFVFYPLFFFFEALTKPKF